MGILYIVPTPVGNMEDMTMRAIRVLKEADLVLAEDTRTSSVLLKHFDIKNRLMAHHKFNEHGTSASVVERLKAGETIALISDAGTPGISDPGFYLAREAAKAGITVQTLPGPTACIPAIVSSGLPCDRFCFEGFIPQKKGRQTYLESLQNETRTMIFYESPYRVVKTLQQFAEVFGEDRQVSCCREISKIHEESVRGTLAEVIAHFEETEPRGEFVIVLAGKDPKQLKEEMKEKRREERKKNNNQKIIRRKIMKKLFFIACCAAMLVTGCKDGKNSSDLANMQQSDSLNNIIAQKDSEINDLMGTFNEVQEGLRQISDAENRVALAKAGEGVNSKQKIKEDIRFIADQMKKNKELIAQLQKKLENSSLNATQLKKTIENLTAQLAEKEKQLQALREELDKKDIHIAELDESINNLHTNVNNLTTESQKKTETINAQDKQLNTAWYVFGTKKELKGQHIMEDGKVMNGNFNKNYFTKIDIRNTTEIKLYSKTAKLLTAHPSSSYSLVRDANKQYTLRITNPQIFWSTSKYLVVLVK